MNQDDAAARCRSCLRHENPFRLSVRTANGSRMVRRPRTGQLCAFGNRRTRRLGIDRGLPECELPSCFDELIALCVPRTHR